MFWRVVLGRIVLHIGWSIKRYVFTKGVTSKCEDGKHIIMLDYDQTELSKVETICKVLQDVFKLSTFYIFESSSNSYHAVCFDKVSFSDLIRIMVFAGTDESYVIKTLQRRYAVLRIASKGNKPPPNYIKNLLGESKYAKSGAHFRFLSGLNIYSKALNTPGSIDNVVNDGKSKVVVDTYATFQDHKEKKEQTSISELEEVVL